MAEMPADSIPEMTVEEFLGEPAPVADGNVSDPPGEFSDFPPNVVTIDEKLNFLLAVVGTTHSQVGWLCQQLYSAMQAVESNPMLRKMMGR